MFNNIAITNFLFNIRQVVKIKKQYYITLINYFINNLNVKQ